MDMIGFITIGKSNIYENQHTLTRLHLLRSDGLHNWF